MIPTIPATRPINSLPKPHSSPSRLTNPPVKSVLKQPAPQVRFGMAFWQDKGQSQEGSLKNPISPNNCVICSIKNLLSDYGYDETKINELIHKHLLADYHAREQLSRENPNNPHADIFEKIVFPDERNIYSVNTFALKKILSEGLGMSVREYTIPQHQAKIVDAILNRKPLLVFQTPDDQWPDQHTLAGPDVKLEVGHAYLVWPQKDSQKWAVQDPWNGERIISTETLLDNLELMKWENTVYNVIEKAPKPEIINGILDSDPSDTGANPHKSTSPQQSAALRQEPAEASTSASKPAQAAPEKPTSKPGSGFQKFRQWLRTRWNGIKQFWQTLVQRIKSWFSGKKSA